MNHNSNNFAGRSERINDADGLVRKGISKSNNRLFADKTARYHWLMKMNPDQKVGEIRGYGKIEGHQENHSKIQNLFRIVIMLYERGYFLRTTSITIYERVGPLCSIAADNVVMLITPQNIHYIPSGKEHEDKPMEQFLSNFNLCVQNGVSPRIHLRPVNTK